MIEGAVGVGKTRLLEEMRERARERGFEAVIARGGELEHELTFGVVSQLFEPLLAATDASARAALLAGPAEIAGSALRLPGAAGAQGAAPDEFAIFHGLYWLCVNAAERAPLLLLVDDAHWTDAVSLRWLAYMIRRAEDMSLVLALAARPDEPGGESELLSRMRTEAGVETIQPGPLSEAAVAELVRAQYGEEAEAEFCRACFEAAGGNPLFARELVTALAAEGVAATAREVSRVARVGPEGIARSVLLRLAPLSAATRDLARAVAVLGTRAEVRHAAALAGLELADAEVAADELAALGLLKRARPLEFAHPVVRSVIYEDIAPGARSTAHWRVARLLGEEGLPPASVAVHLLAAEPGADTWAVDQLRRAAAAERSPETAATYLRRALREPPPRELRGAVLLELGEAEARALAPLDEVIAHLRDAHAAAADPVARARAALALSGALADAGEHDDSREVIADSVGEMHTLNPAPGTDERELLLRAEAMLLVADDLVARTPSDERFDHLRGLAGAGESPGEKALLANLAFDALVAGRAMHEAIELADRALAGNTLLAHQLYLDHHVATWALEFADQLDEATGHADAAVAATRARGSAAEVTFALTVRAAVANRRGVLSDAELDARAALEIAAQEGLDPSLMQMTYAVLVDALATRGEFEAARQVAGECEEHAADTESPVRAFFLHSRGRLYAAERHVEAAYEDFVGAGRIMAARNQDHPAYYPWRSSAARQLRLLDRMPEAQDYVDQELELARVWGAPRSLGVALRAAGILAEGGLPLLAESVSVLERSPALLERAESLLELGAALRRRKERVASKEPLLAALDIAHRCGARPLEERAREELAATGARPRRAVLTGVESLTASERRVADLAAQGNTNKEIAQTLFVSLTTVEKHLGSTYRKLDISTRKELPEALAEKSRVEP